ncbi:MAG: hypothetical protein ACI9N3_002763 [Colwellia sp.]
MNGAFNEYGAKDVAQKTKQIIAALTQESFVIIVNLLNLDAVTPEAFYISNEFNRWLNNQTMIAKAIVITSETIKNIDQQWVPSKVVQNIEYFHNIDDALIWLKEQI